MASTETIAPQDVPRPDAQPTVRVVVHISRDLHRRARIGVAREGATLAGVCRAMIEDRFPPEPEPGR